MPPRRMTDYLDRKTDLADPQVVSVFDELSFWSSRFGALLFQHLDLVKNIDVLDLACGAGFPLFELAHTHGATSRFFGVDVWKRALQRAAHKLRIYGLPNVRLALADGARLPLAGSSVDLIVSNLGVNNFENPQAVLAECFRVAKPDARIVLTTNVKGHFQEFYDVYRDVLANKPACLDRLRANENHRGTVQSVRALVEGAGFRVATVTEDRFYLHFADGSAMLRHFLVRVGFLDGWRAVVDPEDERDVFARLEMALNELAQRQGELSMTVPMLYVEGTKEA
jgi:arsenite methyltransferase